MESAHQVGSRSPRPGSADSSPAPPQRQLQPSPSLPASSWRGHLCAPLQRGCASTIPLIVTQALGLGLGLGLEHQFRIRIRTRVRVMTRFRASRAISELQWERDIIGLGLPPAKMLVRRLAMSE